jgi:hypothetical protein
MNTYLVEHHLRHRLSDMKDAQLEAVSQDVCYVIGQWIETTERQTGEPFVKYLADHLADHVRRNPRDLPKLQRLAEMPLSGEQRTVKKKREDKYLAEGLARRDAAEDRWIAIKEEIKRREFSSPYYKQLPMIVERRIACAELSNSPGLRVAELIAYAELCAGADRLGRVERVKAHLREQRIDALASFIATLCDPMAGVTEPVEVAAEFEGPPVNREPRPRRTSPPPGSIEAIDVSGSISSVPTN